MNQKIALLKHEQSWKGCDTNQKGSLTNVMDWLGVILIPNPPTFP